jgi:hypothetical protein
MYQLYAQIIDGKTENDTLETVPTFNRKITKQKQQRYPSHTYT